MHNWRSKTEELILNHFKGGRGKMCYKCFYEEHMITILTYLACFKSNKHVRSFIIMNQGNKQNQPIYFRVIFSFPLSKIIVQMLPCKDKDGIQY